MCWSLSSTSKVYEEMMKRTNPLELTAETTGQIRLDLGEYGIENAYQLELSTFTSNSSSRKKIPNFCQVSNISLSFEYKPLLNSNHSLLSFYSYPEFLANGSFIFLFDESKILRIWSLKTELV